MADISLNEVLEKIDSLEKRQSELAAAEAEARQSQEKKEERKASFYKNNIKGNHMADTDIKNIGAELLEKRNVTLSSTGNINTDSDLVKLVKADRRMLGKVKFYTGRDASTVIPVVATNASAPVGAEEGGSGLTRTNALAMTTKTLTPSADYSILPITDYALKFSVVDEGQFMGLFAEAFGDKWDSEISSSSNTGKCKGIFSAAATDAANKTTTASGYPTLKEVYEFAGKVKKLVGNFELYTSTEVVTALITQDTKDYNFIKEELAKNGTIRGLRVVETNYTTTGGSGEVIMVASDLAKNYAVGLAQDVEIKRFEEVDDLNTYYRGTAYLAGDVISPKNNFALVCGAGA